MASDSSSTPSSLWMLRSSSRPSAIDSFVLILLMTRRLQRNGNVPIRSADQPQIIIPVLLSSASADAP